MHPTRRWVAALELDAHVHAHVDVIVAVMLALDEQLELVESELRRHARADRRCQALQTIFGSARSSPATCSPRSATSAASSGRGSWCAPAGSTRA